MKKSILTIALLVIATLGAAAQNSTNDTTMVKNDTTSVMESISNGVVKGYKAIENGTVNGYMKIQNGTVSGWNKVKGKCIDILFKKDGETTEEAEARLRKDSKSE